MPRLFLIRHGQASFAATTAEDYDVLSELGCQQASALGRYLAARGRSFERVFVGPLERQKGTAERMREAAAAGGHPLPEAEVHEGLTEYDAFGIIHRVVADIEARAPDLKDVLHLDEDRPRDHKAFVAAVKELMHRWARAELNLDGDPPLESFAAFDARVNGALADIVKELPPGGEAAVITSGGPIGIALRAALGLDLDRTIEIAWTVLNGSFHELRARPGQLALQRFNAVAHLEPEGLVSLR